MIETILSLFEQSDCVLLAEGRDIHVLTHGGPEPDTALAIRAERAHEAATLVLLRHRAGGREWRFTREALSRADIAVQRGGLLVESHAADVLLRFYRKGRALQLPPELAAARCAVCACAHSSTVCGPSC